MDGRLAEVHVRGSMSVEPPGTGPLEEPADMFFRTVVCPLVVSADEQGVVTGSWAQTKRAYRMASPDE